MKAVELAAPQAGGWRNIAVTLISKVNERYRVLANSPGGQSERTSLAHPEGT